MDFSHVISFGHLPNLSIVNIGCSADPRNNHFGPGKRDIWLIHYVTKGKGYFNGHPVTAGQGFLIYRGQTEYYYPDEENPWEFLWITITGDAGSLFERYDAEKKTQIFRYDFVFVIKNIIQYLQANHQKILSCEEILEIFLHIFNQHKNREARAQSSADVYASFCADYIKSHLHIPLKVKELADMAGITPTYLFMIFKEKFGVSPKRYISDQKLSAAKKLLTETNLSVTKVANSVGFPDVLAFSRFFSAKEGVSPVKYRKRCGVL